MSGATVTIRRAGAEDALTYVESLLTDSGLPSADVRAKADCFHVGYDGDHRVGIGGVEAHGSAGLLRSLVVEPSLRGEGYGTALCGALEDRARSAGVERLYLLTTTAAPFFADRGYREVDRQAIPEAIRRTDEFETLCPESATCMVATL